MLRVDPDPKTKSGIASVRHPIMAGNARLEEIATPVSFSGFTAATLEHFGAQLRNLGLDPRQGISGGGNPQNALGDPKQLEPGSMISVQLLSGDMSMGADGTVTYIDGNRIYAFGHRFLDAGPTELPFARSEVIALLPNLSASFKISTAREWMGTITQDGNNAVAGMLGRRAGTVPLEIRVGANVYRMNMIQDRVMTPLVTQMAVFSAIDATERGLGASTFSVRGHIDFDGGSTRVDNVYSGDISVAALAAQGVASPLGFALGSGFDALKLKDMAIEISPVDRHSQLQIAQVVAPRQVRPGQDAELVVTLAGDNGFETQKKVTYHVPVGAPPGPLYFTAGDATVTNLVEFQSAIGAPLHSPGQVLELLNSLRTNTKAYVRVWRNDASFTVDGRDLPNPPPSLALILTHEQAGPAGLMNLRGSKVAEIEIPADGNVVTGSKTVQVEVKE
jgi:hypothetical protein